MRTPRLRSSLSFGRNSSVSENEENLGALYVPLSAGFVTNHVAPEVQAGVPASAGVPQAASESPRVGLPYVPDVPLDRHEPSAPVV